ELSCRDSPDRGTESRRGQVLQHAPSRVLPRVVKSHPMHRGAVGGPATKVRLDTFVLRDPIARRNDRVGPKTTVRVGSRSRADSARIRVNPLLGAVCSLVDLFGSPRAPGHPLGLVSASTLVGQRRQPPCTTLANRSYTPFSNCYRGRGSVRRGGSPARSRLRILVRVSTLV